MHVLKRNSATALLRSDPRSVVFSNLGGLLHMMHEPVRVITVERESGSQGNEFAHDLAERLGWRFLDSELVCSAAKRAGVNPELAAKFDERLDPWYYRYGKAFWMDAAFSAVGLTDEQVFDSHRLLSLVQEEIHHAAKEGNCVLVGRGAACALVGIPGCFHVFVYATSKAKRDWFCKTFPQQAHQADHLLATFDKRRAAAIHKFYQQDWCARGHYHLLLNSAIGLEAMISSVQAAAGLRAVERAES